MTLADYKPEQHEVKFKGGSFTVNGLTLECMTKLIRGHMPALQQAMAIYHELEAKAEVGFVMLLHELPDLAATVIALGAGDESLTPQARALPVSLQIESLEAIFRLTFEEIGGIKNFAALWDKLKNLASPNPQGEPKTT